MTINPQKSTQENLSKKNYREKSPLILLIVSQLPSIALIAPAHSW
jgi:hypothetical protein